MSVTTIPTAGIADDAVDNTKLDLAANYAFTGTVTGAAKIGQVINQTSTANIQTSSTSYVSIFSASITPSSASSKILITHSAPTYVSLSNTSNQGHIALFRDATNITTSGQNSSWATYQFNIDNVGEGFTYLDSPATTSSISYSIQGKVDNGALTLKYNPTSQQRMMGLTLMEVLA